MTPRHKAGPCLDPGNFRPISVLPTLSKLLKRHVHNHLTDLLNSCDLIYGKQSGFRAFHSCQTALIQLIDCWSSHMADRDLIGVILLDLRKAFDLVNHKLLIGKLKIYGALDFFCDYLNGRSEIVNFNGFISGKTDVTVGVPQGSILGPLLFMLYINDLPLTTRNCKATMFADDSTFHTTAKSTGVLETFLNSEMDNISDWCKQNRMCPNSGKTKCMLVTTSQKRTRLVKKDLDVFLDNTRLDNVDSEKLLGVIIQNDLSWTNLFKN